MLSKAQGSLDATSPSSAPKFPLLIDDADTPLPTLDLRRIPAPAALREAVSFDGPEKSR
jgi:hypothetical protein